MTWLGRNATVHPIWDLGVAAIGRATNALTSAMECLMNCPYELRLGVDIEVNCVHIGKITIEKQTTV